MATINRRLAAIRTFYHFLETESGDTPANPVLPRHDVIPSLLPSLSMVHLAVVS
jgi:site-specific recombinase XerD